MSRLIIVSNRLPFQIAIKKGSLEFTPSSGGLVTSIKSYLDNTKQHISTGNDNFPLWIGAADLTEKKFRENAKSGSIVHEQFILHPVFLSAESKDKYYNGFCNDTIWPLFHYFPSFAKFNEETWQEYINVNQTYCGKILALYRPGDTIWIHDYHLMLLPGLLREKLPEASIGFFLHIPFPAFELFRLLPDKWRKEILTGILGADLVGFHTNNYAQYFIKSVQQLLGYENSLRMIITPQRSVTVDTFPVSIDYNKWNNALSNPQIVNETEKIKKRVHDVRIILSVDRLDYAKGLVNRLKGYEAFLAANPDYLNKVVYILIVVPSRDIITKYLDTKKEVEGLVSKINGKYGNIGWTPVIYQYKTVEFSKLSGLYAAADVGLITPLRDGMNLVAKEFVASRKDQKGVLILSETAGASVELGEAIIINPTDINEIANALLRALTLPIEEQIERNDIMQKRLQNYDVIKWAKDFLSQLLISKSKQELLMITEITPKIKKEIIEKYNNSKKRLIFLDYDGTLVPFNKVPKHALPNDEVYNLLVRLMQDEQNTVVIVSGRDKQTMQEWFGKLPLNIIAEHGSFYKLKDSEWIQTNTYSDDWKNAVATEMTIYAERCAGTFVEEKAFSLAWHFRNTEQELGFIRSRELINTLSELATHLDFQVLEGNKVIEARARGVNKGIGANVFLNDNTYDFILAIGDDKTDEDLFQVIPPEQYSIRVGLVQGLARFNLINQEEVLIFLKHLVNY